MIFKVYRIFISPALHLLVGSSSGCRFDPTCSRYCEEAIQRHGLLKGSWFALKRISRCHPFSNPGFDPVPKELSNGS